MNFAELKTLLSNLTKRERTLNTAIALPHSQRAPRSQSWPFSVDPTS